MKAQQNFLRLSDKDLLLTGFGLHSKSARCVLIVPPFAEELNKCRRMMALQARSLAENGVPTCYLDLSGTGDSAGEFADALWADWQAQLTAAIGWLRAQYGFNSFDLLGIRLGAILAAQCAADATLPVDRLTLWQPVNNGAQYLKQFLRTRVVAAVLGTSNRRESVAELREQLRTAGTLEVAGYILNAELADAIEQVSLIDTLASVHVPVNWLEVQANTGMSPATQRALATLPSTCNVSARSVAGEPFWATTEIGLAPELIALTTKLHGTAI